MFEYSFVQTTGRTVRPCTVLASFVGQMLLVSLGILLPLVYTDVLPRAQWTGRFFAPQPPPGNSAKPEAAPVRQRARAPSRATALPNKLVEPTSYPDRPALIVDSAAPPEVEFSAAGVPGGTGSSTDRLDAVIQDALRPIVTVPPPVRVEKVLVPEASPRYRVGGRVSAPRPLRTPPPVYPLIAQRARISGLVCLEAVIATDGRVLSVHVLKGHPLLVAAAVEAVRTWRYTPPLLNGDPIELVMQVDVTFQLGDKL
jgi:periplasmic protein TonB